MIKIDTILTTYLETNTYIVYDSKAKEGAVVVDPGGDFDKINGALSGIGRRCEYVLLTHGHFDHMNAAAEFQKEGATVICHSADADKLSSYRSLAHFAGLMTNKLTPDITLKGGETLNLCGMSFKAIHTPGHTEGGMCYIVEDKIFCGDTIFRFSYGRYDFYGGSFQKLKNSIINKIFNLKGDYVLYPGHGEPSTLDEERKYNPIKIDTEQDEN